MAAHDQSPYAPQQQEQWQMDNQLQDQALDLPPGLHSFGLEALSTAALHRPPQANMISNPTPDNRRRSDSLLNSSSTINEWHGSSNSPSAAISSSNNLSFLLNPASVRNSPIDPSLMSPEINLALPAPNGKSTSQNSRQGKPSDGEPESEQRVAYLLRHFSESPGQWSVE